MNKLIVTIISTIIIGGSSYFFLQGKTVDAWYSHPSHTPTPSLTPCQKEMEVPCISNTPTVTPTPSLTESPCNIHAAILVLKDDVDLDDCISTTPTATVTLTPTVASTETPTIEGEHHAEVAAGAPPEWANKCFYLQGHPECITGFPGEDEFHGVAK